MPRLRVIFLDQAAASGGYNVVLWADVPVARQSFYANAAATSAWLGAQAADNTALQNGSVVEQVTPHVFPPGTNISQIESYLQNQWQNFQDHITNYNPWLHYGSTWDGTTWNLVTNG